MASEDDETLMNLTECGICLSEIENPKALSCLHSFCLKCLKQAKHPPGIIICPSCKEKMTLPPGGVDNLKDNFFIDQLKDWKAIQNIGEVKIPCVCCKSTDQDTKARCIDCNGFLCQQCVSLHNNITPLAGHKIFSIDELRSSQIDMSKTVQEESCKKHKNQILKYFCKTCNMPICCECAVMDHARPDHNYSTIECATEGQTKEIETLVSNCKGLFKRLKDAIDETEEVKTNLNESVDDIKKKMEQERKAYIEAIQRSYKENVEKLNQIQNEQLEKINATMKGLQSIQSKMKNAMGIANQFIKSGSKYNVVANYSTIRTALTKFKNKYPRSISKSIAMAKFKPSERGKIKTVDIGTVFKETRYRYRNGTWSFEKYIGRQGDTSNASCIAVTPKKSILVADNVKGTIKIFHNLNDEITDNLKQPNDIAVTSAEFFVADKSSYVKSFKQDGTFSMQFPAISPDGTASNTDDSRLYAIATDNDDNILVGNYKKQYISKHKTDGTHISSNSIDVHPCFLKVTANGSVVVTSDKENEPVHILDPNGKPLYIIKKPEGAIRWWPSGIACSDDGSIFIADLNRNGGIYSFTEYGEYLGCVTKDVTRASALGIYDDKLVVAQWQGLPGKIYKFKEEKYHQ